MNVKKYRSIFFEFLRYVFVGGIAFVVDFSVLYLSHEFLLKNLTYSLYLSTVMGFLAGMFVNYILSLRFVFLSVKQMDLGKSIMDKILFVIIGVMGLFISEIGMWLGAEVLGINYLIVKIIIAAIVMMWNYLARKRFIFTLNYVVEN